MKITLEANPADAPCCIKIVAADGRDRLIQTDWDFPGIASTFGFNLVHVQAPGRGHNSEYYRPACHHYGTDGTVNCPDCEVTAWGILFQVLFSSCVFSGKTPVLLRKDFDRCRNKRNF